MISKISAMFASGGSLSLVWVMLLFCRIWQTPDSLFARHLSIKCPHKYYILVFGTNIKGR